MSPRQPAKLLRIHVSESDRLDGKPLHEMIVQRCRERGIAGATVFRGLEGYGDSAAMHRAGLFRHDQPMVVTIVDSAEKLDALIPEIEAMMDTGLIATTDVEIVRVQAQT